MPATIWQVLTVKQTQRLETEVTWICRNLNAKISEITLDKLIFGEFYRVGKHCAAQVARVAQHKWVKLLQRLAMAAYCRLVQCSHQCKLVQNWWLVGGTVYVGSGVMVYILLCTTAAFSSQISCENSVWYIYYCIVIVRKFVKWKHWLLNHVSWRVFHAVRSAMNAVNQKSLASSGMSAMLCCSGEKDSAGRDLKSAQNTPSRQPMQPPYTMGTGQFMAPTQQQQQLVGVNLTISTFQSGFYFIAKNLKAPSGRNVY